MTVDCQLSGSVNFSCRSLSSLGVIQNLRPGVSGSDVWGKVFDDLIVLLRFSNSVYCCLRIVREIWFG